MYPEATKLPSTPHLKLCPHEKHRVLQDVAVAVGWMARDRLCHHTVP